MTNVGDLTMKTLVATLLLLPILAHSISPALNDDVLGLIVFKSDIRDPDSRLASWNEDDDDPCSWTGVKCSPASNRVSELSLHGFSLSGKLGRGLLQLRFLHSLSLSNNNLSGSLTLDFATLDMIHSLDLSDNNLSGEIPDGFFAQCGSLRSVSLANNKFSGVIPNTVGSCSSLVALNLSSNCLSGVLPGGIWVLSSLRSLDLSDNLIDGEIPDGIDRMRSLRTVSFRGNRISGRFPSGIGRCSLLKSIDFSQNSLSGDLPKTMWKLSMCSSLRLSSNYFSGEVPMWIAEMRSLKVLDLSDNGFTGRAPDWVGDLPLLEELNLSCNGLVGSVPESMAACKSLSEVDLGGNSLSGDLPSWVFKLGLRRISVSGNNMSGPIEIPTKSNRTLMFLDLSGNAFSSGIPSEIGEMRSLLLLNLSKNALSGSIPSSFGELKLVEVIDLSENRLNASIPLEIGDCSSLTSLILSQNQLTGPIPRTMVKLSKLQTIDLSLNSLNGFIPKELSNLPHLSIFNISHNLISGELPSGSFFNTIPPWSVSDNPALCGSAVNRSCPSVLPKPIVLDPDSSESNPIVPLIPTGHKKILLSISALVAISAAAVIAVGIVTITVLNFRARSRSSTKPNASDDHSTRSLSTDADSGKLVMFSGERPPEFSLGANAILNKDSELGRGGFGAVYKTVLDDGTPVAIKKLAVSSLVKSQEEFEREVRKLGKARHHPNLVTLRGFYWTRSLQLLMYEFVSGETLQKYLHNRTMAPLSWIQRFGIILGMARGIAHLHGLGIVHYNLKSSNVLIDEDGEAKIGDYGLARLLPMLDRYVLSSKVQSALGYMAPEFAIRTVRVTEKSDVYGFGVLVLEAVTGRRPVDYTEDDVVVLCDVVRGAVERGRGEELVDERIVGGFSVDEVAAVMRLGLVCTSQVPSNRPEMGEVVKMLEMIRCQGQEFR